MDNNSQDILNSPLIVIALGADMFADEQRDQGVRVISVDWRPPSAEAEAAYALLE